MTTDTTALVERLRSVAWRRDAFLGEEAAATIEAQACLRYVQETRDYNTIRAEEKEAVGEPARDERLIVAVLGRILEVSGISATHLGGQS